jgi:hypothetical protein
MGDETIALVFGVDVNGGVMVAWGGLGKERNGEGFVEHT